MDALDKGFSRRASTLLPPSADCASASVNSGSTPLATAAGDKAYPFALVLRLRVLQIVCGISAMVMGTVAFIEEGSELNLGLGIPAGAATILAAAASVHTSRGFGGYEPSACVPGTAWAALRFLGPSARIAGPLALLWTAACALHGALLVQASRTLVNAGATTPATPSTQSSANMMAATEEQDGGFLGVAAESEQLLPPPPGDLVVLAVVQLTLAGLTIAVVLALLRVDCLYDPD